MAANLKGGAPGQPDNPVPSAPGQPDNPAPSAPSTPPAQPNAVFSHFEDVPTMRLPEGTVFLTPDQENKGRVYDGKVGIKYGAEKDEWLRLSYTSMKRLIDFCKENSVAFNTQLKKEREKLQVSDL